MGHSPRRVSRTTPLALGVLASVAASVAVGVERTPAHDLAEDYLLLRVSGVSLLEKRLEQTKPACRKYAERTNAFLPWFPADGPPEGHAG
jgi:steroid 5-alpha reductase family enzyme